MRDWWALARQWPSFKAGLSERLSETEVSDMRTHRPAICGEVAELIAGLRRAD